MHLLYLDDSGSVGDASDRHVVLGGFSIFERGGHWLGGALDKMAYGLWPTSPDSLEFHGTDIHSGNKHWRAIPRDTREKAYRNALGHLARARDVRLFAVAIHKAAVSPRDPMEVAFEQIVSRFDQMLGRFYKAGNTQRGLIIADKSTYETSLQRLSVEFRREGHSFGHLHNVAEVPLFVDSKATRLIQFADLVAHSFRRFIELGDSSRFDLIRNSFDSSGGVVHGLLHQIPADQTCTCYACICRSAKR
jgi:hypothetical protein